MALVYLRELDDQTKFAIWKIEETAEELLDKLQLDDVERGKLQHFSKGKRTLHWLATRVLLRHMLQTNEYIHCPSDANGKPYLPDYPYKISLTHSYEYAGIILSLQGECGIDLEIVKDKVVRIKEKFLNPEELQLSAPRTKSINSTPVGVRKKRCTSSKATREFPFSTTCAFTHSLTVLKAP